VTFANLGVLEQNSGKKADAEAAYRQAVTLKAGAPKALAAIQSNLALLLTGDGKIDDAARLTTRRHFLSKPRRTTRQTPSFRTI